MCVSLAPAHFEGTLGAAFARAKDEHWLVYQNRCQSYGVGPNAMVLQIPTRVPIARENFVECLPDQDFLADLVNETSPISKNASLNWSLEGAPFSRAPFSRARFLVRGNFFPSHVQVRTE